MESAADNTHPGLAGLVVIVTGGARGMGAMEARTLARSGAAVVVTDVLKDEGVRVVSEIAADGGSAEFVSLDVTVESGWNRLVRQTIDNHGRVDALVNNAGVPDRSRLCDVSAEVFHRMMDVNAYGAMLGIAAVTAPMVRQGSGSIVNVSSIAGLTAWPAAAYAMSKWATTGLTRIAALELAPHGVRVNSVHPGIIETDMAAGMPEGPRNGFVAATPFGRTGTMEDVAPLVAFLCSSRSSYITGAAIPVDGGFTAAGAAHSAFGDLSMEHRGSVAPG